MKLEIDKDTILEAQDFMYNHQDSIPLHIVRARVESIELVDDVYRWVRFDVDENGHHIKGTERVLARECDR